MSTVLVTPEHDAAANKASEGKKIVSVAKSFVPRLREMQAETDRAARIPEALAEEMEDAGLFSLSKPKEFGGLQTGLQTWLEVVSQLGNGNGGGRVGDHLAECLPLVVCGSVSQTHH